MKSVQQDSAVQILFYRSGFTMHDTISILQDLIRLDTQNPPGNEIIAVEYIQKFCEKYKLDYTTYIYMRRLVGILL